MTLSATTAANAFRDAPALAVTVNNPEVLRELYEVAGSIARRSAKHSAEFLNATPKVITQLRNKRVSEALPTSGEGWGGINAAANLSPTTLRERRGAQPLETGEIEELLAPAVDLVKRFAEHAGGIAADAWASLPSATRDLSDEQTLLLLKRSTDFLVRGGAAALHLLLAGGDVLRALPERFDDWIELLWTVAPQGNAGLVAFIRSSPSFFQSISATGARQLASASAQRVMALTREISRADAESALACLRVAAKALRSVSIEQFEAWARAGLIVGDTRARRSYYALETRSSNEALRAGDSGGIALQSIQPLLRLYIEGLTGRGVESAPVAAVPVESRIGDGRTIHLPSLVAEFGEEELDFRLYKVLAAHAAGQIEFGTYERDSDDLRAAFASLAELYDPTRQDERAAFADDGYVPELSTETSRPVQTDSLPPPLGEGRGEGLGAVSPSPPTPLPMGEGLRSLDY